MRDERTYLWDQADRARMALRMVDGLTFEHFLADDKTREATIYQIALIGEGASENQHFYTRPASQFAVQANVGHAQHCHSCVLGRPNGERMVNGQSGFPDTD